MQYTPGFVAQEVAQVAIRPRRLAYLIEAGNEQQMRRAVSYATTEWGGISHPIVPVRRSGAIDGLSRQVCSVLDVESFVDYLALTQEVRYGIGKELSGTVVDSSQLRSGQEPGIHSMVAVAPGSLEEQGVLTSPEDGSLLAAVALGSIPEDQKEMWTQSGAVFQPQHSHAGLLAAQLYDLGSSIGLTAEQLPTFQAEGIFGGTFFVFAFRRLSVTRAVFFWNMRALCNRFGWQPDRFIILPPQAFQGEVIEQLKAFLERKQQTSPNFVLFAEDSETARTLGRSAGFSEPADKRFKWHFAGQEGGTFDPMTFLPNLHPADFVMGRRREGKTRDVPISVTRPRSTLYAHSPTEVNSSINGYLRLDVRGVSVWTWPRSDAVAKLIHRDAVAVDEGFSLLTSPNVAYRFEFEVPEPQEVCSAFLKERAWTWAYSDKGKYADALIDAHGLSTLSVLSKRHTLDVVGALASTSRVKAEQLLERTVGTSATPEELARVVSQIMPLGERRWLTLTGLCSELQAKKPRVLTTLADLLQLSLV